MSAVLGKIGLGIYFPFSTRNPYTGEAEDATDIEVNLYRDNELNPVVPDPAPVLLTLTAVGQYSIAVPLVDPVVFGAAGLYFTMRVKATVAGITDEAPVGRFETSYEQQGIATDIKISSRAAWDDMFYGQPASEILCFAAIGAGAGVVDTGEPWDAADNRQETFKYFDGTDAFIANSDKKGNRQSVNLSP